MGATEKNGYIFETEYSVMLQKGAIHVYKDGEFIEEITFEFKGNQPDPSKVEQLIENYFN
ncbi:DUF5370 family protein [Bacillus salitolerans]|uniref:DUF5370 family protein n=1 Tax=Bacillus salitolerans TaxID=1437434 RepID=A0ABW4LLI3_9BACI